MLSSLISTIKSAILTETPADVKIHERSLASALIEYNKDSEHNAWQDFKLKLNLKLYKGKSLVLTRFILNLIYIVFLFLIYVVYFICNLICRVSTGKWRGMKKASSGINAIIVSLFFVFAIVSIIYALSFYIRDVVLFPGNAHVNTEGVISIDQPCHETHSFFLLNSATLWQSTGIPISEGDVVHITASGSVYSDIADLKNKAENNINLKYHRNLYNKNAYQDDTIGAKYCIYGRCESDDNAKFGSLLYQISSENINKRHFKNFNDDKYKGIKQIDFNSKDNSFKFEADTTGILFISFNDIYLDEAMYDSIRHNKSYDSATYNTLEKRIIKAKDSSKCLEDTKYEDSGFASCPEFCFYDNIGEILVNIRVEKKIGTATIAKMIYSPFANSYRIIKNVMAEIEDFKICQVVNTDSIKHTMEQLKKDNSLLDVLDISASFKIMNLRSWWIFIWNFTPARIVFILILFFVIDIIISFMYHNLERIQLTIREIFHNLKIRIRKLKIYKYYESHKRRI